MNDRHVIVRADALMDLCELVERALPIVEINEPGGVIVDCLRGALAEVCTSAVFEPVGVAV